MKTMKITLLTALLTISLMGCMGQYPKVYYKHGRDRPDTILFDQPLDEPYPDTVACIIQVSDTALINGKRDMKVYWVKGYKVIADYDIYYLDILKRPFARSVIVWLDQNL